MAKPHILKLVICKPQHLTALSSLFYKFLGENKNADTFLKFNIFQSYQHMYPNSQSLKYLNPYPADPRYILCRTLCKSRSDGFLRSHLISICTVFCVASKSSVFIKNTQLNLMENRSKCAIFIYSVGLGIIIISYVSLIYLLYTHLL